MSRSSSGANAAHQNAVAALFDQWAEAGRAEGMERTHDRAARAAFAQLDVTAGDRYLDIGCGNGYTVRWAARDGASQAIGVDISSVMIERARERSEASDVARFICAPFPNEQLERGWFDCIFSMEVFYYLPDLDGALAATASLLGPGGRFACVVDHYRENVASHSWSDDLGVPLHLLSEKEWYARFTRAGFRDVEQRRIRANLGAEEEPSWETEEGSLVTFGRR